MAAFGEVNCWNQLRVVTSRSATMPEIRVRILESYMNQKFISEFTDRKITI